MTVAVAFALVVLLRRPGVFSPALAWEVTPGAPGEPDDGEEQLPETDRAPRPRLLPWMVAAVAAARVVLLVTLHA